jgi:formylglycine-generating enzyme required for sulfatase activity
LVVRWRTELPREVGEFIAASRRTARWRRVRLWGMVAAAPAAIVHLAIIIWAGFVWWGVRQVEAEWAAKNEFVRIPAGCFEMGSPDTEPGRYPNEGPVHRVCPKSFDLAKFTVTQGEWRRVMVGLAGFPNNPDPFYFRGDDRRPVEAVNWNEAKRFVWLMSLFGRGHYRLPSESEYEYAARAGTTTPRYWGDNIDEGCAYENIGDQNLKKVEPEILPLFANCDDGHVETAPVGSFKPNPWGLYDMLGNVTAWTEDCYVDNYRDTLRDGSANTIGACETRVVRGGSWYNSLRYDRAANRNYFAPVTRLNIIGFRLARTIPP